MKHIRYIRDIKRKSLFIKHELIQLIFNVLLKNLQMDETSQNKIDYYFEYKEKVKDKINDSKIYLDKNNLYNFIFELKTLVLLSLSKDAFRYRNRNLCTVTGRPRGIVRNFRISRITLRNFCEGALILGLKQSS